MVLVFTRRIPEQTQIKVSLYMKWPLILEIMFHMKMRFFSGGLIEGGLAWKEKYQENC